MLLNLKKHFQRGEPKRRPTTKGENYEHKKFWVQSKLEQVTCMTMGVPYKRLVEKVKKDHHMTSSPQHKETRSSGKRMPFYHFKRYTRTRLYLMYIKNINLYKQKNEGKLSLPVFM